MIVWYVCGLALLAGGLVPAACVAARGGPVERLVGLELAAAVTALLLLVLAQAGGQSSLLIVPLVLVVLSVAGTLVFTRLLRPGR